MVTRQGRESEGGPQPGGDQIIIVRNPGETEAEKHGIQRVAEAYSVNADGVPQLRRWEALKFLVTRGRLPS